MGGALIAITGLSSRKNQVSTLILNVVIKLATPSCESTAVEGE
jgi:hypothetical protein